MDSPEYNKKEVVGKIKKFNKKLHDKYDIPARKIILSILGDFVKENPNIYKQDLIITSEDCKYKYLELQICIDWLSTHNFPYDYAYLPSRKSVYCSKTLFLTISKDLKKGYIFDRDSINGVTPRRTKKYSREFVYDIPWRRVLRVDIEDLQQETIKLY